MIRILVALAVAAPALAINSTTAVAPPPVAWATGFSNGNCEAHPHAGVQTKDGGFLMVGDSVCYGQVSKLKRNIFVVKSSATGKEEWSLGLTETGYNYGKYAVELRDGTFLVAGVKTAKNRQAKGGYIQSRYLARISSTGQLTKESVFPNVAPEAGTGDGFMCATETSEDGTVIATGWTRGDIGDPNSPMFIVWGTPFIMKIKMGSEAADPIVIFEKDVQSSSNDAFVGIQGMRIYEDTHNGVYAMAVETHHKENLVEEMGLATVDFNGDIKWFKFFPADKIKGTSMSQSYALTLARDGSGYAVAGHGFKGNPWGRLIKVDPSGQLLWDKRFRNCDDESTSCDEVNTECYGVDGTLDNGFVVTCGTGCTGKDCSSKDSTWMAYVHRTDADGNALWSKDYTTQEANNAGEFIVTTRKGGYAIFIDANSWGSKSTGGNFGLMLLEPDVGAPTIIHV
jgi:hypothetical protein